MQIEGNVMRVCPVQSGTSANGNEWRRQTIVVEFFEHETDMWTQKIVVQLQGHHIDDYHLKEGDKVRMRFGFFADEWNGRYFQTIRIAQDGLQVISRLDSTESTESTEAKGHTEATENTESKEVKGEKDDLPF